jgi:hypothetical protein
MHIFARKWIVNGTYKDSDGDVVIVFFGFIYVTVYKLHRDNPGVMIHLFKAAEERK